MPKNSVSRRSLMQAAAAAAAPVATAQTAGGARQPQAVSPFAQVVAPRTAEPLIIVTQYPFEAHEVARIQAAAAVPVRIEICKSPAEFREKLRDAEAVYGALSGADLDFAPKLRWFQAGGAGVEGLDARIRQSPVVVTNCARTFAPGISETAMGLLLALTRGLVKYYLPQFYLKKTNQPVGTPKSDHHVELGGKTMGIVGLGGIGSAIARRAYFGFDMRILATDAKPLPKPEYVAELHDPGFFPRMAPQVDVLVAAAPSTPLTRGMFDEKVFRQMKKTAYFLAMSRGDLFDDQALVKALREGWIAGAGLDVFPKEPVPPGHPIFDCDNVILSAHTSGWSPDRQERLISLIAENVRRYTSGLPLINVVDKERGY
jgi:phosphoglycerate dehydrogenase-like enzyme